jgi:hypothetical protein
MDVGIDDRFRERLIAPAPAELRQAREAELQPGNRQVTDAQAEHPGA